MFIGSNKKYRFHLFDLHQDSGLEEVLKTCEEIEAEVWRASESFSDYIKKQSTLLMAECMDSGKKVGFCLFNLEVKNRTLIAEANECMVVSSHQGNNLPNLFITILTSYLRKHKKKGNVKEPYDDAIFISLTVNFKLMAAFKRYNFITASNSFRPCSKVREAAKAYLEKEQVQSFSEEHPFFVKGAFPSSLKAAPKMELPEFVPKDFNLSNGDAFLYVCVLKNLQVLSYLSRYVRYRSGFRYDSKTLSTIRFRQKDSPIPKIDSHPVECYQ